jgi:hypothetical protein
MKMGRMDKLNSKDLVFGVRNKKQQAQVAGLRLFCWMVILSAWMEDVSQVAGYLRTRETSLLALTAIPMGW